MTHELYRRLVKEDFEELLKNPQVLDIQAVEITLGKLSIIDDVSINNGIEEYYAKQKEIKEKITKASKEMAELVEKTKKDLLKDL